MNCGMKAKQVPARSGAERQETGEARAQRLVRGGLQALGWAEKELSQRRKGEKGKVKLAGGCGPRPR